jgi:hypothetical protein
MSVGKCLLLSRELYNKGCCMDLVDGASVLLIDPKDIKQFRGTIKRVMKNPSTTRKIGQEARKLSEKTEVFDEYIDHAIDLYTSLTDVS